MNSRHVYNMQGFCEVCHGFLSSLKSLWKNFYPYLLASVKNVWKDCISLIEAQVVLEKIYCNSYNADLVSQCEGQGCPMYV